MNNARTIAALEKTIAQLTAIKDRLTAADAKAGNPAYAGEEVCCQEVRGEEGSCQEEGREEDCLAQACRVEARRHRIRGVEGACRSPPRANRVSLQSRSARTGRLAQFRWRGPGVAG